MRVLDRMITMRRGWIVVYENGNVLCEEDMHWKNLPNKIDIVRVMLKWDDRFWHIDRKAHYMMPTCRAEVLIGSRGVSNTIIHSRTIGYYDMETKERVVLRVDEATGRMNYETTPFGA